MRTIAMTSLLALAMLTAWASAQQQEQAPPKPLAGMRVAMVTGEGFQSAEALMPLAYLTNRGAEVTLIGPQTGMVKAYDNDIQLHIEKSSGEVEASQFDALVLPGGRAPEAIRQDPATVELVRQMHQAGKPVAAICHGPQLLITAGVVEGKTMACYSGVAEELQAAGATYKDQAVVREQNLVTSRVPKDIPDWLAATETLFKEHHQPRDR